MSWTNKVSFHITFFFFFFLIVHLFLKKKLKDFKIYVFHILLHKKYFYNHYNQDHPNLLHNDIFQKHNRKHLFQSKWYLQRLLDNLHRNFFFFKKDLFFLKKKRKKNTDAISCWWNHWIFFPTSWKTNIRFSNSSINTIWRNCLIIRSRANSWRIEGE